MPDVYGILNAISTGQSVFVPILYAIFDVFAVAGLFAVLSLLGFALEWVFKKVLGNFAGKDTVAILEGYLTYPGVAFHESSHALFALLTGAKVVEFSLRRLPMENGNGYVLGSLGIVQRGGVVARAFQTTMTGIAPAVTGSLAMAAMVFLLFPMLSEWWQWVIAIYLFVCILLHTGLSRKDLENALPGVPICLAALLVVFLIIPFDPIAVTTAAISALS